MCISSSMVLSTKPAIQQWPTGLNAVKKNDTQKLYITDIRMLRALFLVIYSKRLIFGLTQEWFRELSFSRLEGGVHDMIHVHPRYGILYFPCHRHQIEGTDGVLCLIRKAQRYTISHVDSQGVTPKIQHTRSGIEPTSPASQAGVLTTTLPRLSTG